MSDWQMWSATRTADDALYDYNNPEQLALKELFQNAFEELSEAYGQSLSFSLE